MFDDPLFDEQQSVLLPVVGLLTLPQRFTVLDLGCGYGRMLRVLSMVRGPMFTYTGVDHDDDRIAYCEREFLEARQWAEARFVESDILEFLREDPTPSWDLVMASEVLMHIPPSDIEAVCSSVLRRVGSYLVTVDWAVPVEGEIDPTNWLHDYDRLLPGASAVVQAGPLQRVRVIPGPEGKGGVRLGATGNPTEWGGSEGGGQRA